TQRKPPGQPAAPGKRAREARVARAHPGLHHGREGRDGEQRHREEERPPHNAENRERREEGNREIPLGNERERVERARPSLVQPLERRRAPSAVIDAPPPEVERSREAAAVNPASPGELARAVVLLRPLPFEQRLGLSVTALLLPIGEHGVTAVVPHHCGRVKPESPSLLLQPPAHIDVVAGHTELRIEPADGLEARLPERHVAAGDMLGLPVGKEDVYAPTQIRGEDRSRNGASTKALRTAARAGLGRRSQSVMPKAQSSTWAPARCHSSVQANTKTPAQPPAKAVRICQSRLLACAASPLRSASRPISVSISGRSPATFCRRARYALRSACLSRYTL